MIVYIVATTINMGENAYDVFQDIILVTQSKRKAQNLTKKLQSGKEIKGLDNLPDYEHATWFERKIDDLSIWKEEK
jgi:hypothetical protein